jgi:hypothetical protein
MAVLVLAVCAFVSPASATYPWYAQPVEEQNLDANGNIKVHEQGTVKVKGTLGVRNMADLLAKLDALLTQLQGMLNVQGSVEVVSPVDDAGGVLVTPRRRTEVVTIAEDVPISPSHALFGGPFDVRGATSATIWHRASPGGDGCLEEVVRWILQSELAPGIGGYGGLPMPVNCGVHMSMGLWSRTPIPADVLSLGPGLAWAADNLSTVDQYWTAYAYIVY